MQVDLPAHNTAQWVTLVRTLHCGCRSPQLKLGLTLQFPLWVHLSCALDVQYSSLSSFIWCAHCLFGLMVKASALRVEDLGFNSCFRCGDFAGWVIPVTLALQWLPCQAPGIMGWTLGLVDLVSVYCVWVRYKVWSATFISVWQHVQLSEQTCPWDGAGALNSC